MILSPARQGTKKISNAMAMAPTARKIVYAAAFGSVSGSSWAFVLPTPSAAPLPGRPLASAHRSSYDMMLHRSVALEKHARLYCSQKDDNYWEIFKSAGGRLFKKGAGKLKSLLPFSKSEEEKRADLIKKETKNEINTMLKDLPLPFRMMGRMVAPLLAQAAGEIAEQSKLAQDMLDEARIRLVNDPVVAEMLGEPLQVGQPFSQSSSTTVINGKSSARVQSSFRVQGPKGADGIATMEANNGEISSLAVNVNGRIISVSGLRGGGSAFGKSSSKKNDNIIEAEIVEKK